MEACFRPNRRQQVALDSKKRAPQSVPHIKIEKSSSTGTNITDASSTCTPQTREHSRENPAQAPKKERSHENPTQQPPKQPLAAVMEFTQDLLSCQSSRYNVDSPITQPMKPQGSSEQQRQEKLVESDAETGVEADEIVLGCDYTFSRN